MCKVKKTPEASLFELFVGKVCGFSVKEGTSVSAFAPRMCPLQLRVLSWPFALVGIKDQSSHLMKNYLPA